MLVRLQAMVRLLLVAVLAAGPLVHLFRLKLSASGNLKCVGLLLEAAETEAETPAPAPQTEAPHDNLTEEERAAVIVRCKKGLRKA